MGRKRKMNGMALFMYLFGGIWAAVGTIFLVAGLVGFLNADSQPAAPVFMNLLFTGLGGLFAAIGYTIVLFQIFRARRKKNLLENGRRVYAELEEIYQDTSVSVNGRYLWRVSCRYMDERGTMHIFRSDGLNFDPSGLLTGLQIPVYLEEGRPDHYAVDLDAVLPRIEIH
ncbi:hypothetical protein [Enterocloster lavalensis]|uniref:DUF3592 domain-containing protein n=1 Tax=Enterocloster lavalensis TaxID=460384 RepID=A0A1I0CRV4_9FIRM|nr:hypothetical protein [Enterocloster lavalensis]SET21972.1 hypothetical protein SAMN05216313_103116 [Enterocloster lavalensis]